jgi:hypothetical protein
MTERRSTSSTDPSPSGRAMPVLLAAGFLLFLGVLAALVGAAFARRDVPVYLPSLPLGTPAAPPGITDTVTVDAGDPEHWRFFSFARGVLPSGDTAGWDLGFRRFQIIASGVISADSGRAFDQIVEAPAGGPGASSPASDSVNAALARWYRYSFVTHLLKPAPRVYVIRTRSGRYAKFEFLSYYCPGPAPGCVTFRYALARDERTFE